jgi:hypothetical protein
MRARLWPFDATSKSSANFHQPDLRVQAREAVALPAALRQIFCGQEAAAGAPKPESGCGAHSHSIVPGGLLVTS